MRLRSRRLATIAGCVLGAVALVGTTAAAPTVRAASPQDIGCTTGYFHLYAGSYTGSGYLDWRNNGGEDFAQTTTYASSQAEDWCFKPNGSGTYQIYNPARPGCLDSTNFTAVSVLDCQDNDYQRWILSSGPNNAGWIQPKAFSGTGMSPEGNNILVRLTTGRGWVWLRR